MTAKQPNRDSVDATTRFSASADTVRQHLRDPEVRCYLLRVCRYLTRSSDIAEDLVQETFLVAYQQAETLRAPEAWRQWLNGIARNLYRRWNRAQTREMSRRAFPSNPFSISTGLLEAQINEAFDIGDSLERAELTDLLGRAMSALPPDVRAMLEDFYGEEMPQSEIAAQHGLTENNAAVRLHRGKRALRKILTTTLREEAEAHGLILSGQEILQETRIWCPYCGKGHLLAPTLSGSTTLPFTLKCSACGHMMGPRVIDYPSDCIFAHPSFDATKVIGNIHGFKPAINRLSIWWEAYLQDGMKKGIVNCLGCGRPVAVSSEKPGHLAKASPWRGFHVACDRCRKMHVLMPSAFTLCAPPVRDFWRRHPRIRHQPSRVLPGENIFIVRVESLTSSAHLDVVFSSETHKILQFCET